MNSTTFRYGLSPCSTYLWCEMSESFESLRELLLQEVRSFKCDVKERLQRLSENVESIIMSSKLNLLATPTLEESYMPCSDDNFKDSNLQVMPSASSSSYHNESKAKASLVISDKHSTCTKVIDLSDFFDDLEVPQLTSSDSIAADFPKSSRQLKCYADDKNDQCISKGEVSLNMPSSSACTNLDVEISSSEPKSNKPPCIEISDEEDNDVEDNDVDDKDDEDDDNEDSDDDDIADKDWQLPTNDNILHDEINDSDLSEPEKNKVVSKTSVANPSLMNQYLAVASVAKIKKKSKPVLDVDPEEFKRKIRVVIDKPTGFKVYQCPACNLRTKTLTAMHIHTPVHTGERLHSCVICNKRFKRASHLKNHLQSHTGEKPFTCDICSKKFCTKYSMKYHRISHSLKEKEVNGIPSAADRPYACTVCDRRFRQKSHRKLHMKIHSNVKQYECVVCSKAFHRKTHLARHMRTHTGEKPYHCDVCSKNFGDSSTLAKHKRLVHLMKEFDNCL